MKIRELWLTQVRHLTAPITLRFDDPLTDEVRPITVLTGSNGCGKTTVLQAVEAMATVLRGGLVSGFRGGTFRFGLPGDLHPLGVPPGAIIAEMSALGRCPGLVLGLVGEREDLPRAPGLPWFARRHASEGPEWIGVLDTDLFQTLVEDLKPDSAEAHGLVHFPHDRWYDQHQRGAIEAPGQDTSWLWRFDASDRWKGSLAQLWVWQNYLDLEQGREGRPNLAPFVEIIEKILGDERRVLIREGRVRIRTPGRPDVEPHELPSGEQQILTLFGELARRLRPGAIILIDEVEISLHPALQRKVMHHFRQLARKYDLQFILTTHSPEILRVCRPEEIIDLDHLDEGEARLAAEPSEPY